MIQIISKMLNLEIINFLFIIYLKKEKGNKTFKSHVVYKILY